MEENNGFVQEGTYSYVKQLKVRDNCFIEAELRFRKITKKTEDGLYKPMDVYYPELRVDVVEVTIFSGDVQKTKLHLFKEEGSEVEMTATLLKLTKSIDKEFIFNVLESEVIE